ncbi:MAG: T9SS type A sorting domain-containing protein, partial [Flavobacteriales bacterium]|nr:T9SS type A sorting domain-containing protein [Flavobacteriales bacterium]
TSIGLVEFYDYSMAFNQNGNIGYVVHQGTDATGQIVPFVHHTMDGGATWMQLEHDFSTIEAYISPAYNGGIDCAVDINGDLHMISCLFEADESITETNRKVYDIVVNMNDWSAHWIADINTERVLDTDPMAIHGIGYNHRIQAARSSDGSRIFAIWTDVNIEEFGEVEKIEFPDIYAFGKDVQTGMVTGVTNFTKYTLVEGACYWMFSSPVTYDTNDTYTLPTTISEAGNNELSAMEHFYIDGISFDKEDFIIENWNMDVTQIPSIEVDVYPNPASDFANLSLNMESAGDVSISLLNAIGQEVFYSKDTYKSGVNSVKIDLNGLEAGVYLYTVESENFATTKRLVVK